MWLAEIGVVVGVSVVTAPEDEGDDDVSAE